MATVLRIIILALAAAADGLTVIWLILRITAKDPAKIRGTMLFNRFGSA
ncbi:hypothetical protein ACFC25_10095 [Pseudarthrobacter sp. NPDC055928]